LEGIFLNGNLIIEISDCELDGKEGIPEELNDVINIFEKIRNILILSGYYYRRINIATNTESWGNSSEDDIFFTKEQYNYMMDLQLRYDCKYSFAKCAKK
jgi:hypothetical protein